jgi:hypothetical protein
MHGEAVDIFNETRADTWREADGGEGSGCVHGRNLFPVMAGLVPAIYVFIMPRVVKTWMPGIADKFM